MKSALVKIGYGYGLQCNQQAAERSTKVSNDPPAHSIFILVYNTPLSLLHIPQR